MFLESMDKACRHLVKESLAILATIMVRQRSILGSTFAAGVPNTYRNKILKSPLSHFDVTPQEILAEVRQQFDNFVQTRAFTSAIVRLGNVGSFRGSRKGGKKRSLMATRGNRGQGFRNSRGASNPRGIPRGALRGVRRASGLSNRNFRGFSRRDRAMNDAVATPRGGASTSGAGFSSENRQ